MCCQLGAYWHIFAVLVEFVFNWFAHHMKISTIWGSLTIHHLWRKEVLIRRSFQFFLIPHLSLWGRCHHFFWYAPFWERVRHKANNFIIPRTFADFCKIELIIDQARRQKDENLFRRVLERTETGFKICADNIQEPWTPGCTKLFISFHTVK